jgi:hypothetical protein
MTERKADATIWMASSAAVALALALSVFVLAGTDGRAIVIALQRTARWSFLLFWLAYAGGSLATLLHWTRTSLLRRGREFGLAYAAAQLVHLGLVVWLFWISPQPPLAGSLFLFFTVGLVWTCLLAALSFGRLSVIAGPRLWGMVRFLGMNYILLAFSYDFVLTPLRNSVGQSYPALLHAAIEYGPFAAFCVAAPILRLAASARRRGPPETARQGPVVSGG